MKDWNDVRKERGELPPPWVGAEPMPKPTPAETDSKECESSSFFLGRLLASYGWVGPRLQPRMWACRCPSEALHKSGSRLDGSTRLCAPDKRFPHGRINCTHPECKNLWVNESYVGNAVARVASLEGL